MSLSKPIINLVGKYLEQLYLHPIRTRAISCSLISVCGNLASQYLSGSKVINQDSLLAFGLFGLFFGGTVPHMFYTLLDRVVTEEAAYSLVKRLFIERLIYTPLFQAFVIYMIARFEGKSHVQTIKHLESAYWPILEANWKFLTLIQLINLSVVPPVLRVLVINLVGFFWSIYLAHKLRTKEKKNL